MRKSYIYGKEKIGQFPRRIKIGRSSVWSSVQIEEWKRAQIEGRAWVDQ